MHDPTRGAWAARRTLGLFFSMVGLISWADGARAEGAGPSGTAPSTSARTTGDVSAAPTPLVSPKAEGTKDEGRAPASESLRSDGNRGDPLASHVFSDDWWSQVRPVFEVHGYFRTRGELFHNFSLGRANSAPGTTGSAGSLWPNPLDNSAISPLSGQGNANVCGSNGLGTCTDKTESFGNMRFRMEPELHISDNLRILGQVDALDNLVLGSTPNAYAMQPVGSGTSGTSIANNNSSGYQPVANGNPYAPSSFFSTTQGPPTSGINSFQNSINVKRVWAEYDTPFGQLRFGRMPEQWGLGMVWNSGSGIDSDWQTNTDRIQFVTRIRLLDLYVGGSWDFVSSGPTSANAYSIYGGQPYNNANLTNVSQWNLFFAQKRDPQLQRLELSRGNFVVNWGVYTTLRDQYLDIANNQTPMTLSTATADALVPVHNWMVTPDVWFQLLYKKFRFEAEGAGNIGKLGSSPVRPFTTTNSFQDVWIQQFGITTQSEFRAMEDKLRLQFGFGWASGDQWQNSLQQSGKLAGSELNGAGPLSTFGFHPDYRVDLIFFRNILGTVEGAYYFRPSVDYDFIRQQNGQRLGGGAAVIWSRASEYVQTPGHARDLGVEIDGQVYYQAKDGTLNDNPDKLGGFYASLQYGVFFPMGGLHYLPGVPNSSGLSLSAAQTLRLFLGVAY